MYCTTKRVALLLLGTSLLASCGRQYATYQPTTAESVRTESAPVLAPVAVVTDAPETTPVIAAAPVQSIDQLDALVRNDKSLATSGKVAKSLAQVKAMLAPPPVTKAGLTAPKLNFAQRAVVKLINKRIEKRLAPNSPLAPQGLNAAVVIGVLAAVAGLVVLLAVSGGGTVGAILLVAGLLVALGGVLAG